ncbi:MAG: hypothetical protein HRT61_02765 [Ekhidna sp.]|nr:hypothetical protein [Ekhidna sp.]
MKHFTKKIALVLAGISMVIFACQEQELTQQTDVIDQDLTEASSLVDDFLKKEGGRRNQSYSITVFKYMDGEVYFDTNRDDYEGYQVLGEESITAVVDYGEWIFWYSGSGMSELDGVEFDAMAEKFLRVFPEEINFGRLWLLRVPTREEVAANQEEDYDTEEGDETDDEEDSYDDKEVLLKYDILYQYDGYTGESIRLDPKIRVKGSERSASVSK